MNQLKLKKICLSIFIVLETIQFRHWKINLDLDYCNSLILG